MNIPPYPPLEPIPIRIDKGAMRAILDAARTYQETEGHGLSQDEMAMSVTCCGFIMLSSFLNQMGFQQAIDQLAEMTAEYRTRNRA